MRGRAARMAVNFILYWFLYKKRGVGFVKIFVLNERVVQKANGECLTIVKKG